MKLRDLPPWSPWPHAEKECLLNKSRSSICAIFRRSWIPSRLVGIWALNVTNSLGCLGWTCWCRWVSRLRMVKRCLPNVNSLNCARMWTGIPNALWPSRVIQSEKPGTISNKTQPNRWRTFVANSLTCHGLHVATAALALKVRWWIASVGVKLMEKVSAIFW